MLRYLIKLIIFTVLLNAAAWYLFGGPLAKYSVPELPWIFAYFIVISLLTNWLVRNAAEKHPQRSTLYLMAIPSVKLFLSALIMVAYALLNKENAIPFILAFGALYFAYTAFEAVVLLNYFKPGKG